MPSPAALEQAEEARASLDPDYKWLVESIAVAQRLRDQKTVSLNLAERKAEREQIDADRLRRENERRKAQGKQPFATLEDLEKSDEVTGENAPDILLDRSAQIMGDVVAGLPRDARTAARKPAAAADSDAPRISTQ
jgi:carboxyl-terminal processing protease